MNIPIRHILSRIFITFHYYRPISPGCKIIPLTYKDIYIKSCFVNKHELFIYTKSVDNLVCKKIFNHLLNVNKFRENIIYNEAWVDENLATFRRNQSVPLRYSRGQRSILAYCRM